MFTLKSGKLPSADVKNIIFFVRPRLELMDIIAENVYRLIKEHWAQHFGTYCKFISTSSSTTSVCYSNNSFTMLGGTNLQ